MKLASLKSGRDGRLFVVSDDLAWCADASHIAPTLQAALDGWTWIEPALRNLATDLAHDVIPKVRFHEREAASPLPRAYLWLDDDGQKRSDAFAGPRDALSPSENGSGGVVVVTGDVPAGVSADEACGHILLIGLTNNIASFSPVFVTPDALGAQWKGGKLHGTLCSDLNGDPLSRADVGKDAWPDFGQLIAHAAQTRALRAGTIIGSAERADAPNLQSGDTVRLWMEDARHKPIFGVIEQEVVG
jgi:fumarylacetoacetate (FAA) hydrolase